MSLQGHVRRMREALALPCEQRNEDWGHDVCQISRHIHESVWEYRPKREFVRDEVIPLLAEAMQAVLGAKINDKQAKELVKANAGNIDSRIRNLRNYVDGKPSSFAPGGLLEKVDVPNLEPEAVLRSLTDQE